jgi:predicted RNase H-like nuclease (RuvC/YqgF family)
MLSKALARRKNILTYIRHVAPRDNNRAQVEKNLERYKIELDVLNAHIEAMQDEMKVLKRQLSDKGVSFTLKAVKPVEPRKRPEKSPYVANGKKWFDDADKAIELIKNLMQRGYSFRVLGSKKVPPIIGGSFGGFGIQWCDTTEGKLFFYTDRPGVFRCYSSEKR